MIDIYDYDCRKDDSGNIFSRTNQIYLSVLYNIILGIIRYRYDSLSKLFSTTKNEDRKRKCGRYSRKPTR